MPVPDYNFNKRPCPRCHSESRVVTVQNDWTRGIPTRYRGKGWIRRKVCCTNLDCNYYFWTIELSEEEFEKQGIESNLEECQVEG